MLGNPFKNPSGIRWRDRFIGLTLLGGMGLFILVIFLRNPSSEPIGFCIVNALTGLYCPSCGTTRAIHLILHGQIPAALRMNALVPPLLAPLGYVLFAESVWRVTGLRIPSFHIRPWVAIGIGVLLIVYGVLRNLPAFAFLAPTAI